MPAAAALSGRQLLTPADHDLIMIDYQTQEAFATASIRTTTLRNNAALVVQSSKVFSVPTIVASVEAKTFSGRVFGENLEAFHEAEGIDRSTMNTWEDERITANINAIGRSKVVQCGLCASVCIVGPALSALEQGFEVYVIADACGDVSPDAHDHAMDRMLQAGARPMTSVEYLLELERDWPRAETCDATMEIAQELAGAYGIGTTCATSMFGGQGS